MGLTHTWFLKIVLLANIGTYTCVYVRVCPEDINNKSCKRHTHNDWIRQLYTALPFLYMTLAIDKLNGHGLSNTACCERLPMKAKVTWY